MGDTRKLFEEHIEDLKALHKEEHGHVRVTMKQDTNLGTFCANMRCAVRAWLHKYHRR